MNVYIALNMAYEKLQVTLSILIIVMSFWAVRFIFMANRNLKHSDLERIILMFTNNTQNISMLAS
jgi:hypothetical protein